MTQSALLLHFEDETDSAARIASAAGLDCALIARHRFPDGELKLRLPDTLPPRVALLRSLVQPNEKLVELLLAVGGWSFAPEALGLAGSPAPALEQITNTHAIGQIMYTKYIYLFQAAGMVLLVAMIGAIVLTHRRRDGVRKQRINSQIARDPKDAVTLRDVETGKGI